MAKLFFPVLFVLMICASSFALDVVADNDDGAPSFVYSGSWTLSSAAGYNGGTYHWASANSNGTATWTPNLPYYGLYNVYAYFIRGGNRSTNVPYKIVHSSGEANVIINQRGSSDQYYKLAEVLLGSWTFKAGTDGCVILTASSSTGVHIADAIRFQLMEDMPPAISDVAHAPYYPAELQDITIRARVTDDAALQSVSLIWNAQPSGGKDIIPMFDDGLHGDGAAGDDIHAAQIGGFPSGEIIEFYVYATDNKDQATSSPIGFIEVGKTPSINLILNEVLASNLRGAVDPDFNEASDWIEIVNRGPDVADLGSFALSDTSTSPTRWRFPAEAMLDVGEYLIIWADSRNTVAKAMHTNFNLSSSGERVILYDIRNDRNADRVDFGEQISDVSYARIPDQIGDWVQTEKPTPGSANVYGKSGPRPIISVPSGIFSSSFQTEIATSPTAEIRYMLDGSAPTITSPLYTKPLTISGTVPLRARAWYADMDPSPVASASYIFNPPADREIPIMDIVIDPADFNGPNGIYTNYNERGTQWERPCHVSVMTPDGSQVYETETGARIHGGYSRGLAKKSLRLYFRSIYGPKRWSLPWMTKTPLNGFQQLVLRSGANDSFFGGSSIRPTYYRDQLMRDWYADMGQRAADGFFVALYINGAYWGLYNATERITDTFMEDTFGGKEWDIVKGSWDSVQKYFIEAVDGDLAAWNEFIEWFENHDVATQEDYKSLLAKMDIENYLYFFALNIFAQNHDWPHNNWITAKNRTDPDARWTFHEWDAEWALGLNPAGWQGDTLTWARGNNYYLQRQFAMPPLSLLFDGNDIDPRATRPINGILDKPEGKSRFISALEEALNFELLPSRTLADADRYEALIKSEIPREANRWTANIGISAAALISNWNTGAANIRTFLTNRPAYIRNLISTFFNLGGTQTISFSTAGAGSGRLQIYGRIVDLPWNGVFFKGSTLALRPIPDIGSRFESWEGLIESTNPLLDYTIQSTENGQITINFGEAADILKPNDVIFNEYWVNDNGTVYASIENRPIYGDWFELLAVRDGVDLRGWRVTNNNTLSEGGINSTGGSIIFPNLPELQSVPAGTFILVIAEIHDANALNFPKDEFSTETKRMIFYVGNGNLDIQTDPNFSIATNNEALVLLAPGQTAEFSDDIGIDFIAEGSDVTPQSFGVAAHGVVFINPFAGIGGDDGAVFTNDPSGGFVNDNGADANRDDFMPGEGGWVVDPPKMYSGDDPDNPSAVNWLTPGARNHGQSALPVIAPLQIWFLY
ncbi:MAG: CotH protein [candidate division BRC1 bacterium ADurb.Bin183]|nr:MAG: CotH protein [candidate division BRC1 bacterium ADurb.Bin183]